MGTPLTIIGKNLPRIDGKVKASGEAKYTVDLSFPWMLYGKFLRSIYPHARILNIDTSKAKKAPGDKGHNYRQGYSRN